MKTEAKDVKPRLVSGLKELHLPTMRESFATPAELARQEALSYEHYLLELTQRECEQRSHERVERLLKKSRLPLQKNLATFDLKRLPAKALQPVRTLLSCEFVERGRSACY